MRHAPLYTLVGSLLAMGVAACTDPIATTPARKVLIGAQGASLNTFAGPVNFSFTGMSVGPNGELIVPSSCSKTYDYVPTETIIYNVSWWDQYGTQHIQAIHHNLYGFKAVGCAFGSENELFNQPYNGGQISATVTIADTVKSLGIFEADGQEDGVLTVDDATGTFNFFAGPHSGCSFLYYDVYGPGGFFQRSSDPTLNWPASSIHEKIFKAYFRCTASYPS